MSEQAEDVMKREDRRYSVIIVVAKALDEIAALEKDARAEADQIIAKAEAKAAQIVADALNNAKAATDEIAAELSKLEQDKAALLTDLAALNAGRPNTLGEDYIRTVGYQRYAGREEEVVVTDTIACKIEPE